MATAPKLGRPGTRLGHGRFSCGEPFQPLVQCIDVTSLGSPHVDRLYHAGSTQEELRSREIHDQHGAAQQSRGRVRLEEPCDVQASRPALYVHVELRTESEALRTREVAWYRNGVGANQEVGLVRQLQILPCEATSLSMNCVVPKQVHAE